MKQHVIVSGAAGALGSEVVDCFLRHDWTVTGIVHKQSRQSTKPESIHYSEQVCDLSSSESCSKLIAAMPAFHAVVHLAGGIKAGASISESSAELFEQMWTINVVSAVNLLRACMPELQNCAGAFVAIGALSALRPSPNRAAYSASKAALISLCLSAAEEGRAKGFRANVVVPGVLRTAANLEWAQNGEESSWTDPRDCAETIVALCSDAQRGVNGAVIPMLGSMAS